MSKPMKRDVLLIEQHVNQAPELVTPPWEASDLGKALFIYVDDDDAFVQGPGHGSPQ